MIDDDRLVGAAPRDNLYFCVQTDQLAWYVPLKAENLSNAVSPASLVIFVVWFFLPFKVESA